MKTYDSYTESGIKWIGRFPSHWKIMRGKYVTELLPGFAFNSDLFSSDETDMPLIRIRDIMNTSTKSFYSGQYPKAYIIRKGDVLVGMDGDFNVAIWNGPDGLLNQRVCKVEDAPGFSAKYAYYVLPRLLKCINDITYSTTVKHLSTFDIYQEYLPVPPVDEQKKIADYLDAECKKIDDLIAEEKKRVSLLEEAKLSVITKVITKGLTLTANMKDSGVPWVGLVPSFWKRHRVKYDLTRSAAGIWGDEEKGNDEDVACYRIADFDYSKGVLNNDNPTIRNIPVKGRQGRLLKHGDLLIEKSGGGDIWPVGRVVRYNYDLEAVCSNFIHSVTVNERKIDKDFLFYYFRFLYANKVNLLFFNQTTGLQNLKVSDYLSQSLYAPGLDEQREIVRFLNKQCGSFDTAIEKANHQIDLLKEYKQSLITEVVTGKRKVF